ncbi:GrpB family protein [Chungangia koreensis]|uniref:GrpB family protein n=1 Tax=Chungangia koreensis TaxID=752657 RepID=A0ABV8X0K9_9LACT
MRKVEVVAFQSKWHTLFEEEAERLRGVLKNEIVEIHHIGSTSVHGLKAKPIIDMMPVVHDLSRIDAYNDLMQKLGYEPKGENGLAGRRYFQKGGHHRTHHVHIYEKGSPEINRHLAFRDYLRSHPDEREVYGDLKEKLAREFPYDIDSYINGKDEVVKEIERKALAWYKNW